MLMLLNSFSRWLYRVSNAWVALLGMLLFLAFVTLVLPEQAHRMETRIGSARSPDMSLWYSPDDLY